MIQRSLEDVIGPDGSPINYIATLVAFLARLHPHKSELSPRKTRSYPREFNSWAMSSLRMVSVLPIPKSPPCLACVCLRTPNSSAVYLMVLVTLSSPCLTWPGVNARLRSCSSHNKKPYLCSPCGTRSPTDLHCSLFWTQCSNILDRSTCSVMPTPMVSESHLNRNSPMAPSASWPILDQALSDNQRNWTLIALEAGCVVWIIRRLRRYSFSVFFVIYTNHECLQQIGKVGNSKPRIQR